jgi:hypothetical protein
LFGRTFMLLADTAFEPAKRLGQVVTVFNWQIASGKG